MPLLKRTPLLQCPWGAAIGAGISLIGSQMSKDKGGGAGASSTSKEPWAAAAPWLMQNLQQGQALQNQYQAQPLSAQQVAAYGNQAGLSDYARQLVPGLLQQMQGQPVGFDKTNPNARAKAWDWNAIGGGMGQQSVANPRALPVQPAAAAPAATFTQQDSGLSQLQQDLQGAGRNPWLLGGDPSSVASAGATGSYGSWKYGEQPKAGTKAYRDMQEFFLMGGNDPWNLYGRGLTARAAHDGDEGAGGEAG